MNHHDRHRFAGFRIRDLDLVVIVGEALDDVAESPDKDAIVGKSAIYKANAIVEFELWHGGPALHELSDNARGRLRRRTCGLRPRVLTRRRKRRLVAPVEVA
jgi:hypothetical protein